MLADTAVLARECAARKVGLAAFNVVLLDHAEAFVQAAENTGKIQQAGKVTPAGVTTIPDAPVPECRRRAIAPFREKHPVRRHRHGGVRA